MSQSAWGTGIQRAATPRRRPVADTFDETFRLYRQNFVRMVTVFGVFEVPAVILGIPFWAIQAQWQARPPTTPAELFAVEPVGPLIAATIAVTVAGAVLGTFAGAAIAYVVSRARTGDVPPLGHVFQALRRHAGPLLGLIALTFAAVLGLGLAFAAAFVALAALVGPASGALILLGLVLGLVALVALVGVFARLTLAIPALIVERTDAVDAIRRSWELTAGSALRTFGILTLGWLVVGVIGGLVSPIYLPGVAEGVLNGNAGSYVIMGLATGLAQILIGPLLPTLFTVMYFDYVDRGREIAISRTV